MEMGMIPGNGREWEQQQFRTPLYLMCGLPLQYTLLKSAHGQCGVWLTLADGIRVCVST